MCCRSLPRSRRRKSQLAFIYKEAGDTPKSSRHAGRRIALPSRFSEFLDGAGRILYDDKRWDEARAAFLKVLQVTEPAPGRRLQPELPRVYEPLPPINWLCWIFRPSNFPEAERYARVALSLDDKGVGYHSALSECLRGEGRVEEAKAENALELRLRLAATATQPIRERMRRQLTVRFTSE